jgi:4-diphosphocytidyl-2-C-methyl-D-erythritol kinase
MCGKNAEPPLCHLRAPAKINLHLAVTGKRGDGYHEIVSLMAPVSLYDELWIDPAAGQIRVECSAADLPRDGRNLAARAAAAFFEASGRGGGAAIRLVKRIPVGAGLGGGSSNAAAVLNGLNRHFGHPLDRAQLHRLALGIGADVPFFLMGRPALATGIGDRLTPYAGLPPMGVVIVFPGVALSTARVYAAVKLRLTACGKKSKVSALKTQPFDIRRHLCNDLEAVAARICPPILEAKAALRAQGADGVQMTGSGSAVFGLFTQARRAALARQALDGCGRAEWQIFDADLIL